MATWDTSDLLARCKRTRRRPSTDEGTSDADWYAMLTDAEAHWKPLIASAYPGDMYGAPQLLTTADGGETYTFPSSELDPVAVEVYSSATGRLLEPGAYWDREKDYVEEEGKIRMTNGRAVTFTGGPYARFVTGPTAIAAGVDSTIKPTRARILLVYHACRLDASRGGMDDPAFYDRLEKEAAFGVPGTVDDGIVGTLKRRNVSAGSAASRGGQYKWWMPNNNG